MTGRTFLFTYYEGKDSFSPSEVIEVLDHYATLLNDLPLLGDDKQLRESNFAEGIKNHDGPIY